MELIVIASFLDGVDQLVNWLNDLLWTYILIGLLLGLGVFFTIRTRFVQFRLFGEMFRVIAEKKDSDKGISAFQAFTISTASRVGTGNLTGVALAIAIGGPGAVFWMWMVAIIGMATAFIESTLAQVYKVRDGENFRGGPAYYMEKAIGSRTLGIIFAILLTLCFGLIFNSVQANTITEAFDGAFGVNRLVLGLIIAAVAGLVIFGGVRRIARVTQVVVPVMATVYLLVAFFVVVTNFTLIPDVFALIVSEAFGVTEIVGGGAGAAIMQGVRRGLFSNEAGMGSVPNAAATANVSHPAKQGLVQSLGVFFDTIIICSATAFLILMTDLYQTGGPDVDGIQLTQASLQVHVGEWATVFVAIAILFFSFSSIIGNYYYGETNIEFIGNSKSWLTLYRLAVLSMVVFGALAEVVLVWNLADIFMGSMAVINLIVIFFLGGTAYKVLKDYMQQRDAGENPVFYADHVSGLRGAECWERGRDRRDRKKR
ncbi:alanine/glycine:cation symporter family protein [Salisediminibacterium halotolerans]|uniref:alanine/glycine:cation symporter family protein n=1 Tax=Salisediminibacterium halotolerans TaxID=517425 RepID=UPI000EB58595|nr:alanine/glycine:cation symporter family protein [Salisediminibacterium halotolerans]RLJ75807.1 AGCS family alanine or glycine:cation symporter [Actinophytocola xinjiangensis]RPE89661.1 AGCS family alanine or glycine:cation symporter [Salisediminibacterium halotolerans]TWG36420.1 AGCS family alanine or glycine:cation symporter [Salisediminibacterium halotolerans]GEL08394.1 amino-acid carrier protein AlsT [Salisediminibacterium halotolerans]